MKNEILLSIVLTAAVVTLGCEKEAWNDTTRVSGNGEIVTQPLDLDPFTRIILEGVGDVSFTGVRQNGLELDFRGVGNVFAYNLTEDAIHDLPPLARNFHKTNRNAYY